MKDLGIHLGPNGRIIGTFGILQDKNKKEKRRCRRSGFIQYDCERCSTIRIRAPCATETFRDKLLAVSAAGVTLAPDGMQDCTSTAREPLGCTSTYVRVNTHKAGRHVHRGCIQVVVQYRAARTGRRHVRMDATPCTETSGAKQGADKASGAQGVSLDPTVCIHLLLNISTSLYAAYVRIRL
jgi:hypothetical protein